RAVDEARVARREGRVVDPEALRDAGPEALEHDVCAVDQAKKDLTPRLALEIQRHAALVASEERDADAERIVGCGDREHLHAEVGEHGGAERTRQLPGEIEHLVGAQGRSHGKPRRWWSGGNLLAGIAP